MSVPLTPVCMGHAWLVVCTYGLQGVGGAAVCILKMFFLLLDYRIKNFIDEADFLFVCLSPCLHVCLFVCLFICLFVWIFVCLSLCLDACLFICVFAQQDKVGTFACLCEDGYEGMLCDRDYDDCVGNLCEEQGTCVVRKSTHSLGFG